VKKDSVLQVRMERELLVVAMEQARNEDESLSSIVRRLLAGWLLMRKVAEAESGR